MTSDACSMRFWYGLPTPSDVIAPAVSATPINVFGTGVRELFREGVSGSYNDGIESTAAIPLMMEFCPAELRDGSGL